MPIPKSRQELVDQIQSSFAKLDEELEQAGPRVGNLPCVDDWSVKDLMAVRVWWTEHVADWIEAGQRGKVPVTPAAGFRWSETPRLNNEIVRKARRQSYRSLRNRLREGYRRVMRLIDSLNDRELLDAGIFEWAGSYPVSRWLSMNTARQYTTARTYVRKALRGAG